MVKPGGRGAGSPDGPASRRRPANQLLRLFPRSSLDALSPWIKDVTLARGETLFEPGDEVPSAYFPLNDTVLSLVLPMRGGQAVEAATVGREGVVGGLASLGLKPAFARGVVQIPGKVARIPMTRLEAAKRATPKLHDILGRYTDCFLAQVLQSVGCAALHPLEARAARWLLMTHDRVGQNDLPLTQEMLAEMLGVARTYLTRIAATLQRRGAISCRRGVIRIERRDLLEKAACECYRAVRQHFERVAPGLYPEP